MGDNQNQNGGAADGQGGGGTGDGTSITVQGGGAGAHGAGQGGGQQGQQGGDQGQQRTIAQGADQKQGADQGRQQQQDQQQKDWRAELAGDNKDALKTLERFDSPKALYNAYEALRGKLSSGELKSQLPDNATDEQKAEWRKANGIPESPDKYQVELPKGVVLGEADKPLVDAFTKFAHEQNLPPKTVNAALGWLYEHVDAQATAQADADAKFKQANEDLMRSEWQGKDYRTNLNAIGNLFSDAPKGLFDKVLAARGPDGRLLGDDPDALRFFALLGRERFPTATLIPMGDGNQQQAIADRKVSIQKMMGDRSSAYWRGPEAEKLQNEYRDILQAEERAAKRGNRAA